MSPGEIVRNMMEAGARTGAGEVEVYLVQKRSMAVAAKEGRIDQVRRNDELAAALRLIEGGRLGFAYTSVFTPEAIDKAAAQAASGAKATDPEPGLALPPPPDGPWPEVDGFDAAIKDVPLETKMDRVLEMEAAAKDFDPRVERVRHAEYGESEFTIYLTNNKGLDYTHSGTVVHGSVMAKAADGDEAEMGYDGDFARFYNDLDLVHIGREAARRATESLGGQQVATARQPVILENRIAAEFLEVLATSFLAETVQKGKSVLADKIGQKIMAERIRIVDDGLYPKGLGTSPADAEGTPQQKTVLIDQGVLQGFLYDITRANCEDCRSTGNAGRGVKSPPGVTTTNLILTPGEKSLDEITGEMGRGLLVTDAMGVHTADSISGDFSFGVSGIWYQNGRPDHPVKGMALAGNIFAMMESVITVGSDLRLFGSIGAPSLLVDGLTLSGL